MSETLVKIPSGSFELEARYEKGNGMAAALICHPHPLYGGSMDNNVVLTLQEVFMRWGWGTLRFNFRGVGRSGGRYGNGEGEVQDALAAAAFLRNEGCRNIHLAGYSYGAWISLKSLDEGLDPTSLLLVSPPLDFLDFEGLTLPPKPCLITLGDADDYCRVHSLRHWVEGQPDAVGYTDLAIFAGCDHFYWGAEEELSHRISAFLTVRFPRDASEKSREPEH